MYFLLILIGFTVGAPFRGVNIGGWLVLESWITVDLYRNNSVEVSHPLLPGAPPSNGPGEWGFCSQLGKERAKDVLTTHWDTWVTREHLSRLAASGVNWLRVPVGYWLVSIEKDEPFVDGGVVFLKRLLGWADELGMNVLVDLHAAPGSQNGHDNSGRTGPIRWNDPANVNRTIAVLGEIARTLRGEPAFKALELLNEPWTTFVGGPITIPTLKDFYLRAYDAVRAAGFEGDIVMSDGWTGDEWNGFMPPPSFENVYLDTHLYRCFGGGNIDPYDNIASVCQQVRAELQSYTKRDWTIVGEYSLCLTNATIVATTGWTKFAAMYAAAQMTAFGSNDASGPAKGSFFWNFRIGDSENEGTRLMWDYMLLLERGLMPQSPYQWEHVNGCP